MHVKVVKTFWIVTENRKGLKRYIVAVTRCVPKPWCTQRYFQLNICILHLNSFLKGFRISARDQIL